MRVGGEAGLLPAGPGATGIVIGLHRLPCSPASSRPSAFHAAPWDTAPPTRSKEPALHAVTWPCLVFCEPPRLSCGMRGWREPWGPSSLTGDQGIKPFLALPVSSISQTISDHVAGLDRWTHTQVHALVPALGEPWRGAGDRPEADCVITGESLRDLE